MNTPAHKAEMAARKQRRADRVSGEIYQMGGAGPKAVLKRLVRKVPVGPKPTRYPPAYLQAIRRRATNKVGEIQR